MNTLKTAILASGIAFLLAACTSQESQIKPDDPLYQNEKCYHDATAHQAHHIPTEVEREIRYNRCSRN